MNVPCATCPWRRTSTAGGADIPNFSIDLMRRLANTVGDGDGFRPIMACHHSTDIDEYPCIGYIAIEGWSNLSVRLMAFSGRLDIEAIREASIGLDLYETFFEMLDAFEAAQ